MKLIRTLSLIFLFFIDVHVKAAEVGACWGKKIPCAVMNESSKRVLKAPQFLLSMGGASLIEQRDSKVIELVRGNFYIETSAAVHFQTPYAKVWCDEECKGLFERQTTQLSIKSLEGHWLVQRAGEAQVYTVPAGLQVEIGEVTESGQALMEFPQSLPWVPTVQEWAELYPGKLADLKPDLEKFRPVWKEAVEAVSDMHRHNTERTIASYEKSQADERARARAKEREDQSLRELFREKNP